MLDNVSKHVQQVDVPRALGIRLDDELLLNDPVTVILQPPGQLTELEVAILFVVDVLVGRVLRHQAPVVEDLVVILGLDLLVYE